MQNQMTIDEQPPSKRQTFLVNLRKNWRKMYKRIARLLNKNRERWKVDKNVTSIIRSYSIPHLRYEMALEARDIRIACARFQQMKTELARRMGKL